MQNQAMAGPAEQSTAQENLSTQRGWLAIGGEVAGALKFSEQIEQQQDAAEGGFGSEKLLQAKIIGGQIVFQFGDAIFHVRPAVIVAPDFFRRQSEVGDEDAKRGKRRIPSNECKATSARNKLVCANRRAPTTTESKKAVKVSTGSMALGEVRRNGRCWLTASR